MRKRVRVIPYGRNLLLEVARHLVREHYSPRDPLSLARVTVLFPHRRPAVYLRFYLSQQIGAPFLPPRIYAIDDLIRELAASIEDPPRKALGPADQAWLLFQAIRERRNFEGICTSFDRFFPWGIRLAGLFEEFYKELIIPPPLPYPEGVPEEAEPLLEDLASIFQTYEGELEARSLTTPGRRFRTVASGIDEAPLGDGPFYIAGFYALTAAEERIFRHLWEEGAEVFWHAPEGDLPPLYKRWKEKWGLELEREEGEGSSPHISYIEAYDLHSELLQAKKLLKEREDRPDRTALVLPDPSALIPTLHELPEGQKVNITLGYPLSRTALFALLEGLMRLSSGRDPERGYWVRDYLAIMRHPFIKRLRTRSGKEGRIVLHLLEERIREEGRPFFSLQQLMELLLREEDRGRNEAFLASEGIGFEEAIRFVEEIHERVISPWGKVETPRELASCVKEVVRFVTAPFFSQGSGGLPPLENEFLYSLEAEVIPALEGTLFRDERMGQELLFNLLRRIVSVTRTPFEGHPLVGLQVMGLLETRLLSFERAVIIDVNEGVLPSHEEVDPLLPPQLRPAVGLPPKEREEEIVWYHFARLVRSSREVYLIWQSSIASGEGLEEKNVRSRFVERLLWEEERKAGRLLEEKVERVPLEIPSSCLLSREGLEKERERVRRFIVAKSSRDGLSPSLLNTYLQCPLKFYYRYILGLRPKEEVVEDVDATALGEVVHKALEEYFRPFLGRVFRPEAEEPERLIELFRSRFRMTKGYQALWGERRLFVEEVAAFRLRQFLENSPKEAFIEGLERSYSMEFPIGGMPLQFSGKVDRVDRREGLRIILDYKTGSVDEFTQRAFIEKIFPFSPPPDLDYEGLREVRRTIKDIQLPLYVLLVTGGVPREIGRTTAAYVILQDKGQENYFLPPKGLREVKERWVEWFEGGFLSILEYILCHILDAPLFFRATEERFCRFCEYEPSCHFAW